MSDRAAFWFAMVAYALVVVTVWAGWITGSRFHRSTSRRQHPGSALGGALAVRAAACQYWGIFYAQLSVGNLALKLSAR